jgi:hypothetical protein
MHTTITTLAVSDDAKHSKKFWTHTASLRRRYPATELTMLPIEDLDDPNNSISIWSNIQAADIVVCLISEEFLAALDDLTDTTGNNLIRDELLSKRNDPQFRIIPVILSTCTWDTVPVFARLQALPRGKTVKQMDPDTAWCEVASGIENVMKAMQKQYQQTFCKRCGDPLPANATYCHCGAARSSTQPPVQSFTNAYASSTTTRTITPQQSTMALSTSKSILLLYSRRDKDLAQECLKVLRASGLPVIDGQEFTPGCQWRDVHKKRVCQASAIIFLLSSDFIVEFQSNDQSNAVALTGMALSQTLLANSYAVVIRYCAYEYAFSGTQPQMVLSVDSKPISVSKRREESWFMLGQEIKAQLI